MKIDKNLILSTLLAATLTLCGCVKEEGIFADNGNFGIVELDLPARTSSSAVARAKSSVFEAEDVITLPVRVHLTGVEAASEDITVKLKIDAEILDRYNDSWQSAYEVLPDRLYAIDSYEVTIPKGENEAVLNIHIYPPQFSAEDFTKAYALGVAIESSSKGTISGNYAEGVFAVSIKNKYDGVYEVNGTYSDYVNAAFSGIYPQIINLVTLTGSTSEVNYVSFYSGNYPHYYFFNAGGSTSYFGNWSPIFTFDSSTNKVTAVTNYYGQGTNTSGRYGEIDSSVDNYYDPDTKTIHVTYYLVQASGRRGKFSEVYTFKSAR
ncbi:DUF1735 domain-containing protein [Sphingobacterium sp. LRF_L2]|uniref:DUF1735 domain-containing protein n=1 Tax=Sphingobacterium sp. LRF_L2 TaxID=3369421 RepID=UPI003F6098F9